MFRHTIDISTYLHTPLHQDRSTIWRGLLRTSIAGPTDCCEIVVPFVRTDDQLADFLTKGVTPAAKFFAIRDVVMNVRRAP